MSTEAQHEKVEVLETETFGYLNGKARRSIAHFTKATFHNFEFSWHHKLICLYLHKWIRGEIPYLIIEAPPRHGKSQLASKQTPAFIHGLNPDAQIVGASYSADLASKNNRDIQRIITSEEYQRIFPETRLAEVGNRTMERALRNADEYEIVGRRGYYKGVGVGSGLTGRGANFLIIDDPIKDRKEADSKTIRDNVWDWWSSVAFTRLEKDSRVLLMNTRWHEDDLAGRLLEQKKSGDEDALPWFRLRLPALFEAPSPDHPVMFEDPRNVGEPLWPTKYDTKRLRQIRATVTTRDWNALYQQRPAVEEGGIVSKSWLKFYTDGTKPPRFSKIIQSWDLNFKEGLNVDFVVGQIWGVYGNGFYLLDQFRERVGFVETIKAIKELSQKWPTATAKLIEAKANGEAVMDMLRTQGVMGIIPVNPTESKEARLWAVQPLFHAGNVFYPTETSNGWVRTTIDELVKFPNTRNDDTVDTTSQALKYLTAPGADLLTKMTRM